MVSQVMAGSVCTICGRGVRIRCVYYRARCLAVVWSLILNGPQNPLKEILNMILFNPTRENIKCPKGLPSNEKYIP